MLMRRRNVCLLLEYEGTHYAGWQWQKNAQTIQETLTDAIRQVVQEPVKIHGAGRTDAGVHATGQVAHFLTNSRIPSEQLLRAINFYLPRDIAVKEVTEKEETFHARYSAISKVYQYTLYNSWIRTAVNRNFCYVCGYRLDISKMSRAAQYLIGTHDFTSFTTKAMTEKNRIRTVKRLDIRQDGHYIYFVIEANGFLYKMVRAIVGTLIEVGRSKIKVTQMGDIMKSKKRNLAGPTVAARGLCLNEVKYLNSLT